MLNLTKEPFQEPEKIGITGKIRICMQEKFKIPGRSIIKQNQEYKNMTSNLVPERIFLVVV